MMVAAMARPTGDAGVSRTSSAAGRNSSSGLPRRLLAPAHQGQHRARCLLDGFMRHRPAGCAASRSGRRCG